MSTFASVISQSTPHIYISALPFAPTESRLAHRFLPLFAGTLTFKTEKPVHWPIILYVLEGHTDWVNSVAFSPDGKCIVSGSDDNTICVWGTEMGKEISGPFEGHTNSVRVVAFSPDGKCIVSGLYGNTIRIWDAETGRLVSGPLKGHTGPVQSHGRLRSI